MGTLDSWLRVSAEVSLKESEERIEELETVLEQMAQALNECAQVLTTAKESTLSRNPSFWFTQEERQKAANLIESALKSYAEVM